MNDKSEGTYTKNLALSMLEKNEVDVDPKFSKAVRDKLKEKQGNGLETYSCSFSLNKDSLCLWNYYSKDASSKGYNIHFHIDDIQDFIEAFRKDKHVKVLGSKIYYSEDEQKKILADMIMAFNDYYLAHETDSTLSMVSTFVIKKIIEQGIFFKHPSFAVEEEYRLALLLYMDETAKEPTFFNLNNKKQFRNNNGFITPFTDIGFNKKNLVGITVSPTLDEKVAVRGLQEIAMPMKYENLHMDDIHASEIPLRY